MPGGRLDRVLRLPGSFFCIGKWKAQAISKEPEVSERTVYRQVRTMAAAGIYRHSDG